MAVDWKPYVCMQTNSTCYRKTTKMQILGVLWHDTGCNNNNLSRYVQPSEGSPTYDKDIAKIGKNRSHSDWNHKEVQAGLNCWIGKFADGSVGTVQSMPWNYRPWGCGGGSRGSCNDGFIQFEICEDAKTDKEYALKAYEEAVRCTAWLCEEYGIDPLGTVKKGGRDIPTILCHWDSYELGLGSGHSDIYDWTAMWEALGIKITNRDDPYNNPMITRLRNDVAALMKKVGWVEVAGKWYYYFNNGKMATGWQKINNKWYYFAKDGVMQTGWLQDGKKKYYLNPQGKMVTGWQFIDNKWYFFANSGAMKTGWLKDKKEWYYLGADGVMQTGWILDGKYNYYLKDSGAMASNEWIHDKDPNGQIMGYYWLSKSGAFTYPHKGGWAHNKKVDKWMFKDSTGWYAKNETVKINGICYKFDADGFLIEDAPAKVA